MHFVKGGLLKIKIYLRILLLSGQVLFLLDVELSAQNAPLPRIDPPKETINEKMSATARDLPEICQTFRATPQFGHAYYRKDKFYYLASLSRELDEYRKSLFQIEVGKGGVTSQKLFTINSTEESLLIDHDSETVFTVFNLAESKTLCFGGSGFGRTLFMGSNRVEEVFHKDRYRLIESDDQRLVQNIGTGHINRLDKNLLRIDSVAKIEKSDQGISYQNSGESIYFRSKDRSVIKVMRMSKRNVGERQLGPDEKLFVEGSAVGVIRDLGDKGIEIVRLPKFSSADLSSEISKYLRLPSDLRFDNLAVVTFMKNSVIAVFGLTLTDRQNWNRLQIYHLNRNELLNTLPFATNEVVDAVVFSQGGEYLFVATKNPKSGLFQNARVYDFKNQGWRSVLGSYN